MNHLATVLELLASKAGAATAAAVLAVGSVTVVQQVAPLELDTAAAEVDEDPGAGDTPVEEPTDGEDTTDGGEPTDGEPTDGEPTDDEGADTGDGTEGAPEEPEQGDDAADGEEDPAGEDEDHGRGSATSERVHAAQVGDADVRPGDPGFGAAVSESARSGGHGQRVSAAARGEAAPEDDGDQAAEPATAAREDRGASAGKGNGKGNGKGKEKARG